MLEIGELVDIPRINTQTSLDQDRVESSCRVIYLLAAQEEKNASGKEKGGSRLYLRRESFKAFLFKGLKSLSSGYQSLDASKPWLIYWILHSLELLQEKVPEPLVSDIIKALKRCHNPTGGFGGGPGQISHLAPTYAAVNALSILGTPEAFQIIDRQKLVEWLDTLRLPDGSFLMHHDGEIDVRGVYCAVAVTKLTNTFSEGLFRGTVAWIKSCQTHEGGFGPVPYMEAHGGYSFCAIAALSLFEDVEGVRLDKLARWTSKRQMRVEGGFQGRTNKLVDSCYSFWQGAILPILDSHLKCEDKEGSSILPDSWLYNQTDLEKYVLLCCQDSHGGMIDKPGKSRDYYHSCYALSGLSVAQHSGSATSTSVLGPPSNELVSTHLLHNIGHDSVSKAYEYFSKEDPIILPF